jgi:3-oxoacyl-(acyl-carrier-protein) synthase
VRKRRTHRQLLQITQRLLRAGVVDAVVVGGVDSLCQTTLRGFHALSVLSPLPCRPFGLDREGMNLGEGGALFVVEREGDARARLLGVGESADGVPAPAEFTAATRNRWPMPLVRPVTVADVDAETPSSNVVHVEPPLVLY